MSLADILSQHEVTCRLGRDGEAISAPVRVSGWVDVDGARRAVVSFGPFMQRVTVDSVLVSFDGGEPEVLRATADGSEFTLPAGMEWEYTLTLSASARQV